MPLPDAGGALSGLIPNRLEGFHRIVLAAAENNHANEHIRHAADRKLSDFRGSADALHL
jgi:hypothetical protein